MKFCEINCVFKEAILKQEGLACFNLAEVEIINLDNNYLLARIENTNLYIEFNEGWTVFYSFEYGPLDTYMVMSIERDALNAYVALKRMCKCDAAYIFCIKIGNCLEKEIRVGVNSKGIAKFRDCQELYAWNRKVSTGALEFENWEKNITVEEYLLLSKELIWLKYIHILRANQFNSIGPMLLKSEYICGGDLIQIKDDFDNLFNQDVLIELTIEFEIDSYLILRDEQNKYLVRNHVYTTLKKMADRLLDPYEDTKTILIYLNENMELIYINSVFYGIQRNIILTSDEKEDIEYEIMMLKNKIYQYNGKLIVNARKVIDEFQLLLKKENISEKEIQRFIEANYKIILGKKYDDLRSEIAIVDISEDISKIDRRLDIAVHNCITDDWEIYELKLPKKRTIVKIREITTFSSEVHKAIAQTLMYKELLSQIDIRKKVEEKYYIKIKNPKYYLLIGLQNDDDWKKCIGNEQRITIKSYTEVIKAAEVNNI